MAQTGTVIPQGLNLRETPGGAIITVLPQDTTAEILEDQGDFLKVNANGQVGFVAASFIQRGTSGGGSFHFSRAARPVAPALQAIVDVRSFREYCCLAELRQRNSDHTSVKELESCQHSNKGHQAQT